jgi:hypothetical protein
MPRIVEGFNLGLRLPAFGRLEEDVVICLAVEWRVKVNEVDTSGGDGIPQNL